ncbi:MAG: formimidoylglutamase [Balneolaceae bacterium]|nr:formimidoylglutamase [Balneolaceae bacterium]
MSSDPKLRDFIGRRSAERSAIHILEFPSDHGVFTNGGRPGASKAPELIRAALGNLTPHAKHYQKHTDVLEATDFAGTIPCENDVEKDQLRLASELKPRLNTGVLPIILGGGHETAFGHFMGYATLEKPVTIINIDAHTDVRALKNGLPHSGSPFRQAIDHSSGCCEAYHVFGLNPSAVSFEHYQFAKSAGSALFDYEISAEMIEKQLEITDGSIMITMDMDAVNQSEAPGVSAPNASGISKELWLELAFRLGKCSNVTSFDICEVNPLFDRDSQTVKLAALTVWHFMLGYSMR